MAKMTLNELKHQIAGILEEAKKSEKSTRSSKKSGKPPQVEAYGFYDKEHDFSTPQGEHNLYRQQGAVNWGPYTSAGPRVDYSLKETDERALRALVREVIENGTIDESSAWAPFLARAAPLFESSWEEVAYRLTEAWYDKQQKDEAASCGPSKPKGQFERTEYGKVKKHGAEKK